MKFAIFVPALAFAILPGTANAQSSEAAYNNCMNLAYQAYYKKIAECNAKSDYYAKTSCMSDAAVNLGISKTRCTEIIN